MVQQRKRVRHRDTFEERLSKEAAKFKEAADKLPPGSFARELLLRRVAQAETASNIDKWLSSKIVGKPADPPWNASAGVPLGIRMDRAVESCVSFRDRAPKASRKRAATVPLASSIGGRGRFPSAT
jgi:hypothetical protein